MEFDALQFRPRTKSGEAAGKQPALSGAGVGVPAFIGPARTGLLVENAAIQPGPGQLTRSEFLTRLRHSVNSRLDKALTRTPWSATARAHLDNWITRHMGLPADQLEQAVLLLTLQTASPGTADALIAAASPGLEQIILTSLTPEIVADLCASRGAIQRGLATLRNTLPRGLAQMVVHGLKSHIDGSPDLTPIERESLASEIKAVFGYLA